MTLLDPKLPNAAGNVIVNHVLPDGNCLVRQAVTKWKISSSLRQKIDLTTGIPVVFRGLNLFSNAEIG